MSPKKNPSECTVQELKEKLKSFGLNTAGTKNDLIGRLMEADPAGEWLRESNRERNDPPRSEERDLFVPVVNGHEAEVSRREMEIVKREKDLLERELAMARRELQFLREREGEGFGAAERRADTDGAATGRAEATARASITAIAELLGYFNGVSDSWEVWERQVRLLATTYKLQDDMTRILIGARLKDKAAEWLKARTH